MFLWMNQDKIKRTFSKYGDSVNFEVGFKMALGGNRVNLRQVWALPWLDPFTPPE